MENTAHEAEQNTQDQLDKMWDASTGHLFLQLQSIKNEYDNIAMQFKYDYGYEADIDEDIKMAMGVKSERVN
jgi:hypothetical protein